MKATEHGSVLVMAVVAMLVLAILGVSFALLADVESRIGVNFRHQVQAEALAEAALERARDQVQSAVSSDFTSFIAQQVLFSDEPLGGGVYSARIDNDCPPLVPNVPALRDSNCSGATPWNTPDSNEIAVITAWATVGSGRARVRGVVEITNVWKHVCSSPTTDGYCNDESNTNGNPTIQPGDPNDANGPAVFDDLPRPVLGCSRVDPLLHARNPLDLAQQRDACGMDRVDPFGNVLSAGDPNKRRMFTYPYPQHLGPGDPRFVIMGPESGPFCNGGGQTYFGYFDCALTTPRPASLPGGPVDACVRPGDSRAGLPGSGYRAQIYDPVLEVFRCPSGVTGMVFVQSNNTLTQSQNSGAMTDRRTMYILNGAYKVQNRTFYGTVVVEGLDGSALCSPGNERDVEMKQGAKIWTGPNDGTGPGSGAQAYGYPLALLIYNPDMAPPTPSAPQATCGDMGSASGTEIHGLIYSAGRLEFNPFQVDGTVVAYDIHAQGSSSTYRYNYEYGEDAPPPGFDSTNGNKVVFSRKSFISCADFNLSEATAPSACR